MVEPTQNGWSQYEKYVVSKLDEHGAALISLRSDMQTLNTNLALVTQTIKGQEDYGPRIAKLETNVVTNDNLKSDRRWLLATGIALLGSIVLPAVVVIAGVAGIA